MVKSKKGTTTQEAQTFAEISKFAKIKAQTDCLYSFIYVNSIRIL